MATEISRLQLLPATSISMAQCRSGTATELYGARRLQSWRTGASTGCQELPMAIDACTMSNHFFHTFLLLPPVPSTTVEARATPRRQPSLCQSHMLYKLGISWPSQSQCTVVPHHSLQGTVWSFICMWPGGTPRRCSWSLSST